MSENKYKVGDELAFKCGGGYAWWEIHKIEKITPSGRMKCGHWELNPDLTIRGAHGYSGPYRAEPVTSEIIKKVKRARDLRTCQDAKWSNLNDEQLSSVVKILEQSRQKAGTET